MLIYLSDNETFINVSDDITTDQVHQIGQIFLHSLIEILTPDTNKQSSLKLYKNLTTLESPSTSLNL